MARVSQKGNDIAQLKHKLVNAFNFAAQNKKALAKSAVVGYFVLSLPAAIREAKQEQAQMPKDKQSTGVLIGSTAGNSLENAWQGVVKPTLVFSWDVVRGIYNGFATKDQPREEHVSLISSSSRAAISTGFEKYAEDAVKKGIGYGFGAKNIVNGKVDCSGFVHNAVCSTLGSGLSHIFQTHSDGQIVNAANIGRANVIKGSPRKLRSQIKAGMVIGIDSGKKRWDRGRTYGIDHTGFTYLDTESGQIMFAESRSDKGAMITPLDDWLDMAEDRGYKLHMLDMIQLAEYFDTPTADKRGDILGQTEVLENQTKNIKQNTPKPESF